MSLYEDPVTGDSYLSGWGNFMQHFTVVVTSEEEFHGMYRDLCGRGPDGEGNRVYWTEDRMYHMVLLDDFTDLRVETVPVRNLVVSVGAMVSMTERQRRIWQWATSGARCGWCNGPVNSQGSCMNQCAGNGRD